MWADGLEPPRETRQPLLVAGVDAVLQIVGDLVEGIPALPAGRVAVLFDRTGLLAHQLDERQHCRDDVTEPDRAWKLVALRPILANFARLSPDRGSVGMIAHQWQPLIQKVLNGHAQGRPRELGSPPGLHKERFAKQGAENLPRRLAGVLLAGGSVARKRARACQ